MIKKSMELFIVEFGTQQIANSNLVNIINNKLVI